jgi:ATPase subunit of ABC transporter with duplicated ATPase domains
VPSIDLSGVHYAHNDSVPLIRDASLRIEAGWTGVVGPNGAGKTTFLRLLAGELTPDSGLVQTSPRRLRAHLCGQEVEKLPADVQTFAAEEHGAAHRMRGLLRLAPEDLLRWPTLSPGERKRWQIGAALADPSGVLLLDEPTNHLDAEARTDLLRALAEYRGVGVVVSHDRTLLERLTSHTVRIRYGALSLHRGSYETARTAWEAAEREERSAHAKLKHERRKEHKRLSDKRRARAKAESKMRTSRNMKNIHDSDARLRGKQKRRRSAEVSLGRDVQLSRRRLGRIDETLSEFHFEKDLGRSLFVDFVPAPVPHLMTFDDYALVRGDRVLADSPGAIVARESRVHLAGPNGSGKTSLLEELVARVRIPTERLLHLPQELTERDACAMLEAAKSLDPDERGRLMNVVAALGVDPAALLESVRPSPGEARKLALADGLARQVWCLVLDEPTNHLDLPSIERLEEALTAYPGALVVVSHDDSFAERLCDERWTFREGRLDVEWTAS